MTLEQESSLVTAQAADLLLDLTGEITKLAVLLHEVPEKELPELSCRLGAFFSALKLLPVEEEKDDGWVTVGEA